MYKVGDRVICSWYDPDTKRHSELAFSGEISEIADSHLFSAFFSIREKGYLIKREKGIAKYVWVREREILSLEF